MEYLEGESLADRLARGALPIDQVIRYGVEIAEALEKAHRANIVHRDLKPGNIMLTMGSATRAATRSFRARGDRAPGASRSEARW
jgi:eukaryotic-like serine/threonine-protein kinase